MNAVKILPHYTYTDYLHWEGKWEVIEGIPYAMSPAPMPNHQHVSVNLSAEFAIPLRNCKKCKVYQPIDYLIAEDTILQPDLLVVCGEITKKFLDFPPVLVVEILSPSTMLKDRHTKYELYQAQRIKYYVIVDPDKKEAEIFQLENSEFVLKQSGEKFNFSFQFEDCKADVNFGDFW